MNSQKHREEFLVEEVVTENCYSSWYLHSTAAAAVAFELAFVPTSVAYDAARLLFPLKNLHKIINYLLLAMSIVEAN